METAHVWDRFVPLDTDPEGSEPSWHGVDVVHPDRGVGHFGRPEIPLHSQMDLHSPWTEPGAALLASRHGELHMVDAP